MAFDAMERRAVSRGTLALALSLGFAVPATAATLTPVQQLGKSLFFDKSLSHAGTQSCASCHTPAVAFTDPDKSNPTSKGDDPTLFGNRNTPSAMYMAFSPTFHFDADEGLYIGGQFWDGRAATLEEQAKGPFLNPVEMGNSTRAEVIDRLKVGSNASAFQAIYGTTVFDDVDTAYNHIADAIAAYERSSELSPFTSKFDYVLRGQATLTAQEQRGLDLFNDPAAGNCAACHISEVADDGTHPLFTDFTYDNIGIPKNFESDFLTDPLIFNPEGADFLDEGLGGIVGEPDLYGAFKVSTLRNLELTGPFGHNGYFPDLDSIIDFYATRDVKAACAVVTLSALEAIAQDCWPEAEFAATMNGDELGNLPLTAQDKADIKAFILTLTDGYRLPVPEPETWAMLVAGFGLIGAAMRRRARFAPNMAS
jgi:cytochrome c peroxidase